MKLNQAISERLAELLKEKKMTQYQLFMKSGVPKSTIGNVINCSYDSVKLRIIHEMCQGLEIEITEFFNSPLFAESNLDPYRFRYQYVRSRSSFVYLHRLTFRLQSAIMYAITEFKAKVVLPKMWA